MRDGGAVPRTGNLSIDQCAQAAPFPASGAPLVRAGAGSSFGVNLIETVPVRRGGGGGERRGIGRGCSGGCRGGCRGGDVSAEAREGWPG